MVPVWVSLLMWCHHLYYLPKNGLNCFDIENIIKDHSKYSPGTTEQNCLIYSANNQVVMQRIQVVRNCSMNQIIAETIWSFTI